MGCHLGWYSTMGCPLRRSRGKYIQKIVSGPPKTIKEKKVFFFIACNFCSTAELYTIENPYI
jgi:hypothetical protein